MRVFPACLLAVLCLPPSLRAEDFSALVIGSSNYFYRGYSKSGNTPTVRVNVDYEHRSGFYGGMWISRVDFEDRGYSDRSNTEFYPYLGYCHPLSDRWRIEASVARYLYDGRLFGKPSDYNEYSVALHYGDLISARVDLADDAYNRGGSTANYEISGRYPLSRNLSASLGLGYNQSNPMLEYDWLYWNVGLSWFFKYGALDLRYVDAADSPLGYDGLRLPELKHRYVFSLTIGF
ncbi:MAG: TorF family putative porin [Methylococcaceae bacterium]|nr:TorF family putative porin [Methylococcaceae bacterium]